MTAPPSAGPAPSFSAEDIHHRMKALSPEWAFDRERQTLSRTFRFKGFAKATYLANLAAYHSDRQGHHADISFGWGYCRVSYTSHELAKLSDMDFQCAALLDKLTAGS